MRIIIKGKLGVLLFGLMGIINVSHAALNDLGNGLVNDTTLNITWMKDANLVKTSCDANNALWQAFDPSTLLAVEQSGNTKAQMCTNNGRLNWFEAEAWIAVLNAQSYLGHNDWRQPATAQADASCESQFAAAGGGFLEQRGGYNCTGSELGNLFNVSLANPNRAGTGVTGGTVGTGCFGTAPHCLQNTAPLIMHSPTRIGRAACMRLILLTRGASIPMSAARAAALRISAICLSGLCVVDNPSLCLLHRKMSQAYQYGV